jgi:hypothetical protein
LCFTLIVETSRFRYTSRNFTRNRVADRTNGHRPGEEFTGSSRIFGLAVKTGFEQVKIWCAIEPDVSVLVVRVSTMHSKGGAMTTQHEPPSPSEEVITVEDVELAERRARAAGERAALAGLSAALSFEESARHHERVAELQDQTVAQGVSHTGVHQRSAARHRQAAVEDRHMAELKRKESEADLSFDTDR